MRGFYLAIVCAVGVASGCGPAVTPDFNSAEPAARMDAAVIAARDGDRSKVPDLIRLLDSDDPATRLVAIRALERLTGETQGYDHAASDEHREAAIRRWEEWHRARSAGDNATESAQRP